MAQQNEMQHLPLSQIHRSETLNPRHHRNATKFEQMVESIRDNGVIQPIVVRPSPTHDAMYEVVAGDTRFEASQKVSLDTIPAIIRTLTDSEAKVLAAIENLQRANLSPIEEAWIAAEIMDANNQNHDDARKQLGWSRSKLDNRLLLSHCIDDVSKALVDGVIKIGHAEVMASLSTDNQRHVLKRILEEKMTVEQTRERMKQLTPALRNAPFPTADCQTCRHNSASNADLFASADEKDKAVCYHKPCFDQKTEVACQIIVTDTKENYGRVHLDTEVTESGYTVIASSNEAGNGVGAEQASACSACEHYGAIVRTGYGRAGSVIHNTCFNLTCHGEKVKAYQEIIAEVSVDTMPEPQSNNDTCSEPNSTAAKKDASKEGTKKKTPAATKTATPNTLRKGVKKLAFTRFAEAARDTIRKNPDYALAITLLELTKNVLSASPDAHVLLNSALSEYATDSLDPSKAMTGTDRDKPETLVALAGLGTRTLSVMIVDVAALMAHRDDPADQFEKSQSGKINLAILNQCSVNTAEWVVVGKEYLDSQTKGVIIRDANDSGFASAYDAEKGEGAFADLTKAKVAEIKSAVLDFVGFDWQGYEPLGFKLNDYGIKVVSQQSSECPEAEIGETAASDQSSQAA